jgi:hypothetical protein
MLYALAGAISGAAWSLIPVLLDSGWAIPSGVLGLMAALVCGLVTGLLVSLIFALPFRLAPPVLFYFLPLITVPCAIALFSVLIWVVRLGLDMHFAPAPVQGDLSLILDSYLFYALCSYLTPFLYIFGLANQVMMRFILRERSNHAMEPTAGQLCLGLSAP